ncbi:prenyltransferase/squalene oxidase repeat-containing protein [Candidatus Laterigemmans baculatus]|nr:hypothetical protein [Candidatus Laterigemmans baculatus]
MVDDNSAATAATSAEFAEGAAPPTAAASEETSPRNRHFLLFQAVPAWFISMLVHMLLILVLALMTITDAKTVQNILTVANVTTPEPEMEQFTLTEVDPGSLEVTEPTELEEMVPPPATMESVEPMQIEQPMAMIAAPAEMASIVSSVAPADQLLQSISAEMSQDLTSRTGDMKQKLMKRYGGTEASEAAVAKALKWLAVHQLPNGAWTFNHAVVCRGIGGCNGVCKPNYARAFNGATALGVLPFLGAGQTHMQGVHKNNVRAALMFLISNGKRVQKEGLLCLDFTESGGSMYAHGLASIALCEAYAMTQDPMLLAPAQQSLNFIAWAQDRGGGWRYSPRTPGDTSVTGWQVMALKSGHLGHLVVPPRTIAGVNLFLDSVAASDGADYHYVVRPSNESTVSGPLSCTPIGLLCRMYLGVDKTHPAIQAGVEKLARRGIDEKDIYYNYYAAQVLRHHGGPEWESYNNELRDWLVESQVQEGHAQGSWHWPESKSHRGPLEGGRLCSTSFATMILEVYYRHMPLYADAAAEDDFPL